MLVSADVHTLIDQLTLEEKASLSIGSGFWTTRAIDRLGISQIIVSDGPHGVRRQPEGADHVGLSGSLPATCFPTAAALGSSWDVALLQRVGEALGREARAASVSVLLGPGINIKRSPLCGRNFEYFSEDPVLSGVLGSALVRGLQSQGVGASVKHFAANNQEEDRVRVSADVDERALREIYLPAFERVVKEARPWTVMCSYNRINGLHASQNRWLLTEVLRDEWGFDGLVVSDWGAVHDRVAALEAGLDLEMPPKIGVSDVEVVAAVRERRLADATLDRSVARVLQLVDRAASGLIGEHGFDVDAHHALAREAARCSAVLLKNENAILPLRRSRDSRTGIIGEFARSPRYQGAGSSQVNPTKLDNALDAIRLAVGDVARVGFAAGYGVGTTEGDDALREEAVALAAEVDQVVVFLGLPGSYESEGFDRTDMELPSNQIRLLSAVAAANPEVVVVLANGSAVRVSDWEHHARAVLECWLAGQAGGPAIADLLFGRANPSGRLAETLPRRLEDNPSFLNFPGDSGHVRYGEGIFVGYRAYDRLSQDVSYPFGHGLSYTTFEYSDLQVSVNGRHEDGDLRVSVHVTITNTGDMAGDEVVQLYVRDVDSSVSRPVRELKGFVKVGLEPAESKRVTIDLNSRDFSFWSIRTHSWVLEAGRFEIAIGASSRDLRLTATLSIDAPDIRGPLDQESTLTEWLQDPTGGPALRAAVGVGPDGRARGILGDEELLPVVGSMPLRTIASFSSMGIDRSVVEAALAAVSGH